MCIERNDKLIKIKEVIIVEGKYDKIKLSSIIDGTIIETHGFGIFKDKKQLKLIRSLAETNGLLIITDSDAAGFVIRNYLKGSVPKDKIKHAYIPDIYGKEKRKTKASKEGKIGVEGVPKEVILEAIRKAGISFQDVDNDIESKRKITKMDLFATGLSGRNDSAQNRKALIKHLGLPEHITTNSLIDVLNCMMDYEEYIEIINKLKINIL